MAICLVSTNPNGSAELYEQVLQRVAANGEIPPPGAVFQVAGPDEGGWRVISVWDSREAFERFREERLIPAFAEAGVNRDDVTFSIFEAHSYMAGDLSRAAQPV
jgi:heme-degrading monooxygenase HmoA